MNTYEWGSFKGKGGRSRPGVGGLTATPYRRDELDDLIALQLGPVRHTMTAPEPGTLAAAAAGGTAERSLTVHLTEFVYGGNADPSAPGGIAAVYRDLVADDARNQQVLADVLAALDRGRNCLLLTQWTRTSRCSQTYCGPPGTNR